MNEWDPTRGGFLKYKKSKAQKFVQKILATWKNPIFIRPNDPKFFFVFMSLCNCSKSMAETILLCTE